MAKIAQIFKSKSSKVCMLMYIQRSLRTADLHLTYNLTYSWETGFQLK